MTPSGPVFVGLGSNLGDREENLRRARARLREISGEMICSSISRTDPVGVDTVHKFLNQVVLLKTTNFSGSKKCLDFLLQVEQDIGRDREQNKPDRVIDLDLLYFAQQVSSPRPIVPHPRLHRRRFVLKPLTELAPGFIHPVFAVSQRDLLGRVDRYSHG